MTNTIRFAAAIAVIFLSVTVAQAESDSQGAGVPPEVPAQDLGAPPTDSDDALDANPVAEIPETNPVREDGGPRFHSGSEPGGDASPSE